MRSRIVMRAAWIALAAAVVVVTGASSARADESVTVKVPFAFIVGDHQMPGGEYVVQEVSEGSGVISVRSLDGREIGLAITIPATVAQGATRASVAFEKFENHYFLSGLIPLDGNERQIVLTPVTMQHELHTLAAD
jgi:hypothetical protein